MHHPADWSLEERLKRLTSWRRVAVRPNSADPGGTGTRLLARVGLWLRARLPHDRWDRAALALLAGLLAIVALTFRHYGISWDEQGQNTYGKLLLTYYLSGLTDRAAFGYYNLYLYGGGFDLLAAVLNKVSPFGEYETRHLLGGLVGIGGVAVAWRLGRRLGGPRAGFLAAALLAVMPIYYGHMFINPKDVPFAVAMLGVTLFIGRTLAEWPKPRASTVIGLGVTLGLALGTRIGAVIAGPVLVLPLAVLLAREAVRRGPAPVAREAGGGIARLLPALPIAYALMIVCWPWAGFEWQNPLLAIRHFGNLDFDGQVLFDGEVRPAADMPGSYLPELLVRQLPELVLAGLAAALACALAALVRRRIESEAGRAGREGAEERASAAADGTARRGFEIAAVAAMAALPVLYFVAVAPTAFNGIRHYIFVLPPLAVLAALGLEQLLAASRGALRGALAAACLAGLALPVTRMVQLHPEQYVYFNDASGGLAAASGQYELDYWGTSLAETTRLLARRLAELGLDDAQRPWKVFVCADETSAAYYFPRFLKPVARWEDADLVIGLDQFYCPKVPPTRQLVRVYRNGALLSWAGDREGFLAQAAQQYAVARLRRGDGGGGRHGAPPSGGAAGRRIEG